MATEFKLSYTGNEINEKLGKVDKTILYTEQTLTEEQKAQARENIGAVSDDILYTVSDAVTITWDGNTEGRERGYIAEHGGEGYTFIHISDYIPSQLSQYNVSIELFSGEVYTEDPPHYLFNVINYPVDDGINYFLSTGVYVLKTEDITWMARSITFSEVKKLDNKFIPDGAVSYDKQTPTDSQKAQARENIGVDSAVLYTKQTLDTSKKVQALENIGACNADIITKSNCIKHRLSVYWYTVDVEKNSYYAFRSYNTITQTEVYERNNSTESGTAYAYTNIYGATNKNYAFDIKSSSVSEVAPGAFIPSVDLGGYPCFVSILDEAVNIPIEIKSKSLTFPSAGLYIYYNVDVDDETDKEYLTSLTTEIRKIDEDLLPDTVPYYEEQELTNAQKAQARANIGADFSYDFATVNKASTRASDYDALKYIETNWSKEPMNLSVQGFPVVKVDIVNKRFCTFYTDSAMHVFKWETNDTNKNSKVTWVSKSTLADKSYVDEQIGNIESVLNSIISIQEALVCGYQVTEVETSLDSIIDTQNSLIGGENE